MSDGSVVHIGSVVPVLAGLTAFSDGVILDGFVMAYLHRRIEVKGETYEVVQVFADEGRPDRIMATLQRCEESL